MVSIISEKAWKIALFLSLQNVAVLHFHCFRLPGAFSQRHHAQGLRVRRVADWIWMCLQIQSFTCTTNSAGICIFESNFIPSSLRSCSSASCGF